MGASSVGNEIDAEPGEKNCFMRGTDMAEGKINPLPGTITHQLTHKFIKLPYKVPSRGVMLGYPDDNSFADFMQEM